MIDASQLNALNTVNPALNGSNNTSQAKGAEDRFLKLLVAQMKNQDPLNPLDNAQVTSQMAQISTVSGLEKVNTTLAAMTENNQLLKSMQATAMIGHSIMAPGKSLPWSAEGKTTAGAFRLNDAADAVKVTIRNQAGAVVAEEKLGAMPEGIGSFTWDGKLANGNTATDGNYTFSVEAISGGKTTNADTLSIGLVRSVLLKDGVAKLDVLGMGDVDVADVQQIM